MENYGDKPVTWSGQSLAIYMILAAMFSAIFIFLIAYSFCRCLGRHDSDRSTPSLVAFFVNRCRNVFRSTPGLGVNGEIDSFGDAYRNMFPSRAFPLPAPAVTRHTTRRYNVSFGVGGR